MDKNQKSTKNLLLTLSFIIILIIGIYWLAKERNMLPSEAPAAAVSEEFMAVPLSERDAEAVRAAGNTSWQVDGDEGWREATVGEQLQLDGAGIRELTFEHVAPGEYSEVYAFVVGFPGTEFDVTLSGSGVVNPNPKRVTIGEDGSAKVTWRITEYGPYTATSYYAGTEDSETRSWDERQVSIIVN